MSNMNDGVNEIETKMHDHVIHQMLNEINYRVLEINSSGVFFIKTTDDERTKQSMAGTTENIEGDGTIAENDI